jgi:dipeptidyl-peptidase-4
MKVKISKAFFPNEYVRTQNFSLGAPRTYRISKDGRRIFFLRSASPTSSVLDLWMIDLQSHNPRQAQERLLVSVDTLVSQKPQASGDPEAERIRRERLREAARGITAYSIDDLGSVVGFTLQGDIYVVRVDNVPRVVFKAVGDATDLKISPTGRHVAYVSNRELYVSTVSQQNLSRARRISPASGENLSWGLADFIASEEMRRHDGYWWAPDGESIVLVGVDNSPVPVWYISNPADPSSAPQSIRYPQAGTQNAKLSLMHWHRGDRIRKIKWNQQKLPYIAAVRWRGTVPTVAVQDRQQRTLRVFDVDERGRTKPTYAKRDDKWVELIGGIPTWDRNVLVDAPDAQRRRLKVGNAFISAPNQEVRKYIGRLTCGPFVFLASDDARETHVWLAQAGKKPVKLSREPGVFDAIIGGSTVVVFGTTASDRPHRAEIIVADRPKAKRLRIRSYAPALRIRPRPRFQTTGGGKIHYAILYPDNIDRLERPLPVLMDPYGGPLVQKCVRSSLAFTTSQWFADQGFAVIIADGRGTPGRGRRWEKSIAGDLIHPVLEDQILALKDAARSGAPIDLAKVSIRGWSFGGYLAAMAVLLRPDIFHAAIAGAPVTDWRMYDTHYSERYLGDPAKNAKAYDACSAVRAAPRLSRPLMLIHGLNDDNVVCGNTFALSRALFDAGRPHTLLPLIGITHMSSSSQAATNLLVAQLDFLRNALK